MSLKQNIAFLTLILTAIRADDVNNARFGIKDIIEIPKKIVDVPSKILGIHKNNTDAVITEDSASQITTNKPAGLPFGIPQILPNNTGFNFGNGTSYGTGSETVMGVITNPSSIFEKPHNIFGVNQTTTTESSSTEKKAHSRCHGHKNGHGAHELNEHNMGHHKMGHHEMEGHNMGHHKMEEHKMGHHEMGQHEKEEHKIGQHEMEEHKMEEHSMHTTTTEKTSRRRKRQIPTVLGSGESQIVIGTFQAIVKPVKGDLTGDGLMNIMKNTLLNPSTITNIVKP